jgi:hypothetical protein
MALTAHGAAKEHTTMGMSMLGVRLPKEQADQIRHLADGEQTPSLIIRRFITEGLARLQEEAISQKP